MRIVLVHGSWHDGKLWAGVAAPLRAAGHEVHTPTIAGHGKGADKRVSHAQCTQSITDYLVQRDLRDAVLLGHSYGGTIISKVVEAVPERIRRLVYWNAFVLNDGESLDDNVPPHYRALFAQLSAASADGSVTMPFPIWREAFVNDADLETAQRTYEWLSPEPYQPFVDKLDLGKFYTLQTPRSYLNCTEDIALPPGPEWGWHPRMSSRLGLYRLVQIAGSHEVMFTAPERLAEAIVAAGRD
jgi:pimeloyl-ACP methyl ester carboxylesterase